MLTRRQFVRTALVAGGASSLALVTQAQQSEPAAADSISAETQQVIDRSLLTMASLQAQDGSFSDSRTGFGNVAITGLAGLALMAAGNQPGRGRFPLAGQEGRMPLDPHHDAGAGFFNFSDNLVQDRA